MAKACSVCAHPKRDAIDAALRVKSSVRNLAERYNLSHMAIPRHRNHLSQARKRTIPLQPLQPVTIESLQIESLQPTIDPGQPHRENAVEPDDPCTCEWCLLSGYKRLAKAWALATEAERERFAAETQIPEESW